MGNPLVLPNADYGSKVGQPAVGAEVQADLDEISSWINGKNIDQDNILELSGTVEWGIGPGSNVEALLIGHLSDSSAIAISKAGDGAAIAINKNGSGSGLDINGNFTPLAAAKAQVRLFSNAAETFGEGLISAIFLDPGSTIPAVRLNHGGSGPHLKLEGISELLVEANDFTLEARDAEVVFDATTAAAKHSFKVDGVELSSISDSGLNILEPGGNEVLLSSDSSENGALLLGGKLKFTSSAVLEPGSINSDNIRSLGGYEFGPSNFHQLVSIGSAQAQLSCPELQFGTGQARIRSASATELSVRNSGGTNIGEVALGNGGLYITSGTASGTANPSGTSPTIPYGRTYGSAPIVIIFERDANTSNANPRLNNAGTSTFQVDFNGGAVGYNLSWIAIGRY